ncbi:MAG: GGDEF domain-containing protein [Desulfobacterota bacterium]|nr:GGDEF domain-containing protein [Thermodesulfobacteriota bacterium]
MQYKDTIEQSKEYLRLAVSHMSRFKVPFDPVNYSVWYEYVSGNNKELRIDLDHAMTQTQSITPELNKNLFEKYIVPDQKQILEKIREELRKILENILKHVSDAGGQLNNFGSVIKKFSQELKQDLDVEAVSRVVEGILNETKEIMQSGANLRERMQESADKVEKLSRNLEQIQEQATTDLLTGAKNRRYLTTAFYEEAHQADAAGGDLCLIIADIDHFKTINDTHGHLVGDKVLKRTADLIMNYVKVRDIVTRYGGDEFVILLPSTPLQGAVVFSEKLCGYFKNLNWKSKDKSQSIESIHLSIGVAQYRKGESLETVIQRADKALYKSKQEGRCRVTSETDLEAA